MKRHTRFTKWTLAAAAWMLSWGSFTATAQPGCPSPPPVIMNGELTMSTAGDMNSSGPTTVNSWWVSHGSPSTGAPAPGGGANGMWMWSYSGRGEGIYTCYRFQQGRTYRICFWVQNTRNCFNNPGNLMVYAANGLTGAGPGSTTIAVPASSQLISNSFTYSGTWVQVSYTFTANSNYNQLWIYPFRAGPSIEYLQYELNVDRIQVTEGQSEQCVSVVAPCQARFQTAISGLILNGSPTRTFTIDAYDPSATYTWEINGMAYTVAGSSFSMDFPPGMHTVCLTVTLPDGRTCRFCQTFCVIPEELTLEVSDGPIQGRPGKEPGIVSLEGNEAKAYKLYPNPARSELSVEYFTNVDEPVKVQLIDMTGRVLKTVEAGAHKGNNVLKVPTAGLNAGAYSVRIFHSQGSKALPFTIVK